MKRSLSIQTLQICKNLSLGVLMVGAFFVFSSAHQAHAMTITPLQIDLAADPGTAVGSSFSIYNDSDKAITLYTQVQNFEAADETGNPKFVNTTDGLVSWTNLPATVTAPARTNVQIPFTVTVPKDAEPSGYFAGLFASLTPPTANPSTIALGNRIGTLLLFRVNGNIPEGITVLNFGTANAQRFFTMLPIDFTYRFQNSGGDRIQPLGDVIIRNSFGKISRILNANQLDGNVLPDSIRKFETAWVTSHGPQNQPAASLPPAEHYTFFSAAGAELTNFAFGFYTAHLNLAYGYVTAKSATATFTFFVFPWQLISIVIVILILLWFICRFFLKRYNRYIIAQANSQRKK